MSSMATAPRWMSFLVAAGVGLLLGGCDEQQDASPSTAKLLCAPPADFAQVVPLSDLGGQIEHIATDDTHLYFTADTRLYRAPLRGGEPEQIDAGPASSIVDGEFSFGFTFFVRDHDLLVLAGFELWSLAKDGSDVQKLGDLPDYVLSVYPQNREVVFDGQRLFLRQTPIQDDDTVRYFAVAVDTAEARMIGEAAFGHHRTLAMDDRFLYVSDHAWVDGRPTRIHRLPKDGGAFEPADFGDEGLSFEPIGVRAGQLFATAFALEPPARSGLYRLGLEDGRVERLLETFADVSHLAAPRGEIFVVSELDETYVFAADVGGDHLRPLGCVAGPFSAAGLAPDGVLVASYTDDDRVSIVQIGP